MRSISIFFHQITTRSTWCVIPPSFFPDCRQCQFLLLFTTTLNSCNTISVFSNTITVLKFSRWVIWTGQHISPPDLLVFPLRWLWFWTVLKFRSQSCQNLKKKSYWGQLIIVLTKCYSITFCPFNSSSCFKQRQDKIVTIWYGTDMWSFELNWPEICRSKLDSLRLRSNNAEKLSRNIVSNHVAIHS